MGYGTWSNAVYDSYSTTAKTLSRHELYGRSSKSDVTRSGQQLNVEEVKFRESRDSEDHPVSTPIMVALDVTGSMGIIPEKLTKGGLGILVNEILQRKPVTDPHLLFMGIGDAIYDRAPLQVTQFESDNRICEQLTDIWLESGGGGNNFESYDLAWGFASYKTMTDAWEKRQQKGFLFTIGDEEFPKMTPPDYFGRALTNNVSNLTPTSLLEEATKKWNVYHIIINQGSYASNNLDKVINSWKQHLHNRALPLSNYEYLPQLIVSAIALETGVQYDEVMSWWESDCRTVLSSTFNFQQ